MRNLPDWAYFTIRLVFSVITFYIIPLLVVFGLFESTSDLFSCHSTSFLPTCDSEIGTYIYFSVAMAGYYFLLPFPLALPTGLTIIFIYITRRKQEKDITYKNKKN